MSFDDGLEVRGFFLTISKVFEKVSQKGIIFMQNQNGISSKLLSGLYDLGKWLNNRGSDYAIRRWELL